MSSKGNYIYKMIYILWRLFRMTITEILNISQGPAFNLTMFDFVDSLQMGYGQIL